MHSSFQAKENQKKAIDAAFRSAAANGHLDIVKYLFSLKETFDDLVVEGEYVVDEALRGAATNGHFDIVKFLVERDVYNIESLELAAANGHFDIVKVLAEYVVDEDGEALRSAAANGHFDIAKFLVELMTKGM